MNTLTRDRHPLVVLATAASWRVQEKGYMFQLTLLRLAVISSLVCSQLSAISGCAVMLKSPCLCYIW